MTQKGLKMKNIVLRNVKGCNTALVCDIDYQNENSTVIFTWL